MAQEQNPQALYASLPLLPALAVGPRLPYATRVVSTAQQHHGSCL